MRGIPSAISPFRRTTWKPQVVDDDGGIYEAKFSGTPWLGADETWPVCQNCEQPMPLFLQLNLGMLPEGVQGEFGEGLLQLFYCTNADALCESECEAFFPFTMGKLVRVVASKSEMRPIVVPDEIESFPPKRIIGWDADDDYPNWEEGIAQGISLTDRDWQWLSEQGFPRAGDKLAGWPLWIQGIEYPDCPVCGQRMRLVFQIDSNDHLPYLFGDMGCGHITQCAIHKDQITFAWACS